MEKLTFVIYVLDCSNFVKRSNSDELSLTVREINIRHFQWEKYYVTVFFNLQCSPIPSFFFFSRLWISPAWSWKISWIAMNHPWGFEKHGYSMEWAMAWRSKGHGINYGWRSLRCQPGVPLGIKNDQNSNLVNVVWKAALLIDVFSCF